LLIIKHKERLLRPQNEASGAFSLVWLGKSGETPGLLKKLEGLSLEAYLHKEVVNG
jgi:hypothetical protein